MTIISNTYMYLPMSPEQTCTYGPDVNDDDAGDMVNFRGFQSTPRFFTNRHKHLLAEVDDPGMCGFRLVATTKSRNGQPILANIILYFGQRSSSGDRFPNNLKIGGAGACAKLRGEGVRT